LNSARKYNLTLPFFLIAALLLAVAMPAGASAKPSKKKAKATPKLQLTGKRTNKLLVGIGDNNAPMFSDNNYRALGTQISRKVLPYDFWQHPLEAADLDLWMQGAAAAGVEPLISFNHSEVNPKKLPTVLEFKQSLSMLLAKYPYIKVFSPWNEANHKSQPTVSNPRRAAEYYNAARQMCKGCRLVAADILDQTNMIPWVTKFRKYAKSPKLWGLHNYTDSNRNKPWNATGTKKLLSTVPGQVWLTEVGGIVAFNVTYSYDPQRAALATIRVLKTAQKVPRIERVYLYCWFGVSDASATAPYVWDSGIADLGGLTVRPAYGALQTWLSSH
jgi:hypothetical protein